MTKLDALERLRAALARNARRPARERFADMVKRGAIDEQGRVLLRGPDAPGYDPTDHSPPPRPDRH